MFGMSKKITDISLIKPEVQKIRQSANQTLAQNLKELEKFVTETVPVITASQQDAYKGIEQLAKNIKSMMK